MKRIDDVIKNLRGIKFMSSDSIECATIQACIDVLEGCVSDISDINENLSSITREIADNLCEVEDTEQRDLLYNLAVINVRSEIMRITD